MSVSFGSTTTGTTYGASNYNRSRGQVAPYTIGPGPNSVQFFKPRGTPSGPSNVSSLAAGISALSLGTTGTKGGSYTKKYKKQSMRNKTRKTRKSRTRTVKYHT